MKIVCDKCNYIIDRDKKVESETVEEYNNIYGTFCPNCGNFLKPLYKPKFVKENELILENLKNQVLDKIREKIRRNNNDN